MITSHLQYTKMEFLIPFLLAISCFITTNSRAFECKSSSGVNKPIVVDQSGRGRFRKIQDAVDFLPSTAEWKHIRVSSGIYREKVTIPQNKPCIFLEGDGKDSTFVEWNAHKDTETSVTFNAYADNFVAKKITFKNTYGLEGRKTNIKQAVAVRVRGDKSAFFECGFVGLQDTLWDVKQRHFFHNCYIEGAMDFIFGDAQSIYQNCLINVTVGDYLKDQPSRGYITAQKRNSGSESSGFVFKNCKVFGTGKAKAYLGRAWGAYSRVIFYNSQISDVIAPEGWHAWNYAGNEGKITYAEVGCIGGGAGTSKRVAWAKRLTVGEIREFVETSYIDEEDGWTDHLSTLVG